MSKSIIREYIAWWPKEDIKSRQEALDQCMSETWTSEYMRSEGFSEDDIKIVEHLQPGDSHRFHIPACRLGPAFDVVVCYDGKEYEDTSYQFQAEREEHHLNWYEVSGRGDNYDEY